MTQLLPRLRRAGAFFALALFVASFFAAASLAASPDANSEKKTFDLPAGDAETTLREFTKQAKVQLVFDSEKVAGIKTAAVHGEATPREALDRMFADTGLVVQQDKGSGAFTLRKETPAEAKNASSRPASDRAAGDRVEGTIRLETFEVMGTKLLNMDIPRSRDGVQPYAVFDRATIERSGATSLEGFLKQRLTMNTAGQTSSQVSSFDGNTSAINLRGLGANQTLILVDGHRIATPLATSSFGPQQGDINGIPLAAVERIEILPTTASGIYGGSATGGVVNVILRRDYAGAELKLGYENTFDSDSSVRTAELSAGWTLEGGRTNIMLAASLSDDQGLLAQDRGFILTGPARIQANNPAAFSSGVVPPMGATTNIRSLAGQPLFGAGTPIFASVPVGYDGNGGLAGLQAGAGRYNLDLPNSAQAVGRRAGLLNNQKRESLTFNVRRRFSSFLDAFVDFAGSENKGNFPRSDISGVYVVGPGAGNPFGQTVVVRVPTAAADAVLRTTNDDLRVVAGAIVKLPGQWQAEGDYTWNRHKIAYRLGQVPTGAESAAITAGTLNVFRDTNAFPLDFSPYLSAPKASTDFRSTLEDGTVRAAGPLGSLPGGEPRIATLLERRNETFSGGISDTGRFYPDSSQGISSAYAELTVPVFSTANAKTGLRSLELLLAGRYDRYTVHGVNASVASPTAAFSRVTNTLESSNPTIGLRYAPVDSVVLRVSYGTGFLPPSVQQLVPNPVPLNSSGAGLFDPRRGNSSLGANAETLGGNPNLKPEKSESWSGGVVVTPPAITGLRLSLDYTRIHKRDNITTLLTQQVIDNEAFLPGRVTRAAPVAGDPFGVGVITALDLTLTNISRAEVEAYDAAVDYSWKLPSGSTLSVYGLGTWQTHYKTQLTPLTALVENAGVAGGVSTPVKFKGNAGVTWELDRWTFGWNVRYFASYLVSTSATTILNQGGPRVPSQTYQDVFVRYRFAHDGNSSLRQRITSGLELTAGVKNVFNREPPFDASNTSYYYSFLGDPRLASYYLSVRKSF